MKFLYFNNRTAWINRSAFAKWLRHCDVKMHERKVLLLTYNESCHYGDSECYNAKLAFLPPNKKAQLCGKATTKICGRGTDRVSVISESVNGWKSRSHNESDRTYWTVRPNWI